MARDYYQAAKSSSRTIAPLLLYYGLTNLAKALTLIFGGRKFSSLMLIGDSHGLSMNVPQGKVPSLEECGCKVNESGTFTSFLEVFSYDVNFQYCGKDELTLKVASYQDLKGRTLTLKDILLEIVQLKGLCLKTFDEAPNVANVWFRSEIDIMDHEYHEYKRFLEFSDRGIESLGFSELQPDWDRAEDDQGSAHIISKSIPKAFRCLSELQEPIGDDYISANVYLRYTVQPLLSTWIAEYIGIFILGNIVRYHPDLWVSMISRKQDSRVMAIVEQFIGLAKSSFPTAALRILDSHCVIKDKYILPIANLPKGLRLFQFAQ